MRQLARQYALHGALDVVFDAHELHANIALADVEQHVARSPVAILGTANAPGVHEVDALDLTVPGYVGVPERDHVPDAGAHDVRHLRAETVRAVLGPVDRVESRGPVDQGDRPPRKVAAQGP